MYFLRHNQRRPATYQTPERPAYLPRPILDQSYGFQRNGYSVSPAYNNQHAYCTQRRDAVPYNPTFQGQNTEGYPQASSARPLDSQVGLRMDGHDSDHQQHYSDYGGDGEGSSTAAVVGSRGPQSSFATQQPYQDFNATPRAGDPYIQPARPQLQYEPFMNHGGSYGWTNEPVPGQYNASSYQQGGNVHHPMNPGVPFMPTPGPLPTQYNSSQAWFDPTQSMNIPPPLMYAPASAFPPTNYSGVPVQPLAANVPYVPGYQSQPPVNNPLGDLSNNAVDQGQYPQVNNNENMVGPAPVLPEATTSSGRSRRGKGKGRRRGNEA